jgi:VWFA-related protein
VKFSILAVATSMMFLGQQASQAQQQLPDSPAPQITGVGNVTPGKGAPQNVPSTSASPDDQPPSLSAPSGKNSSAATPAADQQTEPEGGTSPGQGLKAFTLGRVQVNFVELPFTVKDKQGQLVPGIDWREVRVFENGVRQHISNWTVDPFPISAAFVIDQSLPYDVMGRVNNSLAAVQGAFAAYDELAIFTYNNGPTMRTDFTGAQSARVGAVLERSKTTGREAPMYYNSGPLSQTTNINGHQFDPNTAPVRNSNSNTMIIPKETHTLNDAIFMAARSLANRPVGRRRVIYVISDGKEQGSKAKYKEVVTYLQTHNITLYATLVGDSATWGIGFLDRYHLPFMMRDNILPKYVADTGGQAVSEYRQRGIEQSFQKIAEQVRTQYTVGYYSHEPFIDGKYRTTEVLVLRPGLDVISKKGYFPTPFELRPTATAPAAKE